MGERRKNRSFWSSEEETNSFQAEKERHSMHDDGKGFHLSRSTARLAYADRSHWDPMNESHMDSRHGTREDRKRYHKSSSPRIDEMELHSYYNQTHEYDHRHSQRYSGRARSRSGSRSRNRGRDRSRSRSLSRSRSNGNIRAHFNSRSPIGDYGLHQSHEWSEKRSSFDKSSSSQVCRHFAAGRCIRGSQCRYIHSNRMNRKDADVVNEDDYASEIWRNRADRDRDLGHSYDRSSRSFDVSESYRRENVQFSSRSRSDVPCKNFVRGKCQWGNNCRFSHHLRSDDFGRGTRNDFSDDANEHRPHHNWKALCKFYAAGKCDRINCRFSHSEANLDNQESRFNDVSRVSHDQQNWWSGASERDLILDPVNTNANGTIHVKNGQNEDYWGSHSVEREMTSLEITKVIDNSLNWEKKTSLTGESGSYYSRGDEFITENDRVNEQEEDLLISSQMLENHNGAVNVYGQSLPVETSQHHHHSIYSSPKIPQKPQRLADFKSTDYLHVSDVRDEVKDRTYPIPSKAEFTLPDLNQSGGNILSEKSILNGSYGEPSNHLNKSSSVMTAEESLPITFRSPIQNSQKVRGLSIILEPKVSQCFPNSFSSEHSAQATNCALTTTGQVEISSSLEKMPSFPDISVSMPLVNMTTLQHKLASALLDLSNSTKDIASNTERENHKTTWDVDKKCETPIVVPPSSSPVVDMEPDTSIVKPQDSPKLKQKEDLVANHEIVKETEGIEENKDRGKVEEGVADKDDRGLRMFKFALVEFVKETLKPTWKEGRMSREAHKNVVKKVVDKVCSSIQDDQIPRTRERIEHYLSYSKPKVTKLVQAYVERCQKAES